MKNILAENMIRFGAKNLTETSKQKLGQLAEQTATSQPAAAVAVTSKVDFVSGATPERVTKPTIQFSSTRDRAPILYLRGAGGNDSNVAALSRDAVIIPGKPALQHNEANYIDFLYYATRELFGDLGSENASGQNNIVETLTALIKVKDNLAQIQEGAIIIGTINNILTTYRKYGEMPFPVFEHELRNEVRTATEVINQPAPWHQAVRRLFNLPSEDYVKYNQDPNYRQTVFNNWYGKNSPTKSTGTQPAPPNNGTVTKK